MQGWVDLGGGYNFLDSLPARDGHLSPRQCHGREANPRPSSAESDVLITRRPSHLWTKVHEIFRRRRRPIVLADCLYRGSFRRYSPLSLKVVENRTNVKAFPQVFGEGWPRLFYSRLLARFIIHRLAKFGCVPFAGVGLRSLAMN